MSPGRQLAMLAFWHGLGVAIGLLKNVDELNDKWYNKPTPTFLDNAVQLRLLVLSLLAVTCRP